MRSAAIISLALVAAAIGFAGRALADPSMANPGGRALTSLDGKWPAIIDPYDFGSGTWMALWKDQTPKGKTDIYEYSFEGGPLLDVPGDFNHQMPELHFFEGSVWCKRKFDYRKTDAKRLFLHFGGANYLTTVYLNGQKIGEHEGGFTPFQFEITDRVKDGENALIVRVNNERRIDGVPALGFDWENYGGLTRDVSLIETPTTYIDDYSVQLEKGSLNKIAGWVRLNGSNRAQTVRLRIPEAKIDQEARADAEGMARFEFPAELALWSPENPKLYNIEIASESDSISEQIGFRTIESRGMEILLNGKPVFLRGVSFHEEIPMGQRRATSDADALTLLTWAKELGCNFVRLAHYPQNEHTVRMAEKMGLMMWEEIPVYQGIDFADAKMQAKINAMLEEMVRRDKNRCGIVIWSIANETRPGAARDAVLTAMAGNARKLDPTRLIGAAFDDVQYRGNTVSFADPLGNALDIVGANEYIGWYRAWPSAPSEVHWETSIQKPFIISEFGGEALYGNHGPDDVASSWSEEYQEKLYRDQIEMQKNIPFLRGTTPWLLVDFLSPRRLHPTLQNGFNRKGLISDQGQKKKAFYIMQQWYAEKAAAQ